MIHRRHEQSFWWAAASHGWNTQYGAYQAHRQSVKPRGESLPLVRRLGLRPESQTANAAATEQVKGVAWVNLLSHFSDYSSYFIYMIGSYMFII